MNKDYLLELFDYDKDNGKLYWKKRPLRHFATKNAYAVWNAKYSGKRAGTITRGYRHISIDFKGYREHRLIWLIENGTMPKHTIDHINGNKTDNRITNLRDVENKIQNMNMKHKGSRFGLPYGVSKNGNKYVARIVKNRIRKYLGTYDTLLEASSVINFAKIKYGYTERHGS